MAHKKGAGSSNNGRESHSKRLGIKIFGGQQAIAGNIIVRQRGTKHHPDKGVGIGKDHTLFALVDGTVLFKKKMNNRSYVSVIPGVRSEAAPKAAPVQEEAPQMKLEPEVITEEPTEKVVAKKAPKKTAAAEGAETPKKAKAAPKKAATEKGEDSSSQEA